MENRKRVVYNKKNSNLYRNQYLIGNMIIEEYPIIYCYIKLN